MGKTRDLFKKTGDIKGTFCPKMGTIKDRSSRDLVDTKEIKKRWKEYMEELYLKKILMNQITTPRARHSGVRSVVGLRKHCCQ